MITLFHFVRLAIRNLRRAGQRGLVALLCITFGVMSLVAMTMLAKSIESAVDLAPAQVIGGDLSLVRKGENAIRSEDIEQLKSLQQSGEIGCYTLIAYSSSIMFHARDSGEIHFAGVGMGIEPDKYPLAGSLTIGDPVNAGLPTLLQQIGDVVVTRDLAEQYNLKVGDPIVLSDPRFGIPVEGALRGIAYDTPNHQGDKIYYSVGTAQALANGGPAINTVIVNASQTTTVAAALEEGGWSLDWVADQSSGKIGNMWMIGLRGAGILGLLVGGIGIANTMQVLLRRRQREIAIWKTLGYRLGDLRLIFTIEAALLGLSGSLLGAGLGVLISSGLLEIFRRTSTLLYQWTFSLAPPLMGVLVGTLTTVIFACWAIVTSGQVRPMALLRNEPVDLRNLAGCQSVALGLFLAVLFTALTCLVMSSVIAGIGVLVCILIGIAILGGFFRWMLWVCTRILPVGRFPLARLAFTSLRRRRGALVFAMIALFTGVLSMSLGLVVAQISGSKTSGGPVDVQGYNLNIMAAASQENVIRQAVQAQDPEKVSVGYRTELAGLRVVGSSPDAGDGGSVVAMDAVLVGCPDPQDYILSGADWASHPDGVYAYKRANLKVGSQVEATLRNGTTKIFTVVGSYDLNYRSMDVYPPIGLLMTDQAFTRVVRPDLLTYFVRVTPQDLNAATTALSHALPQATVLNLVAYAARFMQSYKNLYILAIAMAGLALLAGFLLVANSISLALLDRRYEIGILKTLGYSRRQILSIFALEYGLVALLATGAGVFIIQGLLAVLAFANHLSVSVLLLNLPSLALIVFCGVGLTLLTVLGVSWAPTLVPPVIVLNERSV